MLKKNRKINQISAYQSKLFNSLYLFMSPQRKIRWEVNINMVEKAVKQKPVHMDWLLIFVEFK